MEEDNNPLEKIEVGMYLNRENGQECHPFVIVEKSSTGKTVKIRAVGFAPDPRKDLRMPHQNWIYNKAPWGELITVRYDKERKCWKKAKNSSAYFLHTEPVHRRNWEM